MSKEGEGIFPDYEDGENIFENTKKCKRLKTLLYGNSVLVTRPGESETVPATFVERVEDPDRGSIVGFLVRFGEDDEVVGLPVSSLVAICCVQ